MPAALMAVLVSSGSWGRQATAQEKVSEPKIEGDLKEMQGEWISKDEEGGEGVWKFEGDHVTLKTPTRSYDMKIKINPKGQPEKQLEFDVSEQSPNAKGYQAQGIYKFTDDGTLKICFGDGESGRPKEFKTDFGKSFAFDLKKKKKDAN
jgi:uncharacterized protein (TIGR03067 family)